MRCGKEFPFLMPLAHPSPQAGVSKWFITTCTGDEFVDLPELRGYNWDVELVNASAEKLSRRTIGHYIFHIDSLCF